MQNLQSLIETAFENRHNYSAKQCPDELRSAIEQVLAGLTEGSLRVATPSADSPNGWQVHQWVKEAVLLSFVINSNRLVEGGMQDYFDKVPLQFTEMDESRFADKKIRVVPPATVRHGAYIGEDVVLMPSYVNIGAYVGKRTMIDTWATVGACAQIGANCHISGGAGIGGVLEPLQANPTIIGDNCFIGARSEVVEGVIVEPNCVIGMGVFIGQSTKIYDRTEDKYYQGRVPEGSVVVAGSLPDSTGRCHLNCAVIVKRVDAKTRAKVGINELMRQIEL